MVFWSKRMLVSILGTTIVVLHISPKEKLLRKKYMGRWSLGSRKTTVVMTQLPAMERRYIRRTMVKNVILVA